MSAEGRRIASIVLPNLPCELVRRRAAVDGPLGVIIDGEDSPGEGRSSGQASATLDAVDDLARRLGVRSGLKVTEAAALTSQLSIHHVAEVEIVRALGVVAEVALTLGSVASIAHPEELDTVWLDITGAAHLVGGELALKHELQSRVEELGHRCRVAIADGPRLARALALWGQHWDPSSLIALPGRGAEAIAPLPVKALPIPDDALSLLLRLGILTVGDLARLPRAGSSARLQSPSSGVKSRSKRDGTKSHVSKIPVAAEVLALVQGYDPMPLRPYRPPEILEEHTSFEEGVDKIETLLFVLRGMTSRLSTRLSARGISVARIHVSIPYDRSIFRLRYPERADDPDAEIERWEIELPMPLSRSEDLFRAVRAKLEARSSSDSLAAPALGLSIELSQIAPQRRVQLDLSRDVAIDPDALVSLLAELSAEIGPDRLGTLRIDDVHRPEQRSLLISPHAEGKSASAASSSSACSSSAFSSGGLFDGFSEPTRLLPEPLPLGSVNPRALSSSERPLAVGHHMYQVGSVAFSIRLSGVEWWTPTPVSRDYARVSLSCRGEHPTTGLAWIYWDRTLGEAFLHGWWE
jgi:protein ImuB